MDQQPNYRRRRIAFATAAVALLALINRPYATPDIRVIEIAASDDGPVHVKAAAVPLAVGAVALVNWATERLTR